MQGGRPSRSWVRKTYTVSEEVEEIIRKQAAELDIDPGTVIDILVWNTYLKPSESQLKQGEFSEDELERIFAEDFLEQVSAKKGLEVLADSLCLDDDNKKNLRKVLALVVVANEVVQPADRGLTA